MTWFDTLLGARYRGACSDAMLAAAVRLNLITAEEAELIKQVPNGGFRLAASPAPVPTAAAPAEPGASESTPTN
ncbi:hypothetical protein [Kineococcus terrestris]|uniref:hypothetical protein n=1 Tax=Kineococcus terrestris TaxID=2044856 RepID=UPI0034DB473A